MSSSQKFALKFKTSTPRFVAVTLDVERQKMLYRLNKDPSTDKSINVDSKGPYVPFVSIMKAEIEVITNPYPRLNDNQRIMVRYFISSYVS